MPYILDVGGDGCHHQHCGEGDHDSIGEIVDVKKEAHETNANQDECLKKGVGHMELHSSTKNYLYLWLADTLVGADLNGFLLDFIFYQKPPSCKNQAIVQ